MNGFEGLDQVIRTLIETGADSNHAEEANEMAVEEFNGQLYQRSGGKWIMLKAELPDDPPVPKTMAFFTLQGLCDYINANPEHLIPEDGERVILQVVDETSVALISQPSESHKSRYVIARADAHTPAINFGRYMDTDEFCTTLLSKFVETDARKQLFAVVKSMVKEQSAAVTDDGVGQQITVKQGVSMASNVTFQNPVPLKPRRTFTEIDQPESNFTLRVNKDAEVAIFESDGGAWKNEAVERIKGYLEYHIKTPSVIVIA